MEFDGTLMGYLFTKGFARKKAEFKLGFELCFACQSFKSTPEENRVVPHCSYKAFAAPKLVLLICLSVKDGAGWGPAVATAEMSNLRSNSRNRSRERHGAKKKNNREKQMRNRDKMAQRMRESVCGSEIV